MELFDPVQKSITIPSYSSDSKTINKNKVRQLLFKQQTLSVSINRSKYKGYYLLKTDAVSPFDEIYLKPWNTSGKDLSNKFCLKISEDCDINSLNESTQLEWNNFPLSGVGSSPDNLLNDWKQQFVFKQEDKKNGKYGLRRPQIGALHAISAYLTSDDYSDPVTVVLPTGTGKTETMISTQFYHQCRCILVLVPSTSLRTQIGNKFIELGYLPELGVIPKGLPHPRVVKLKRSIKTKKEAKEIYNNTNVIVATPNILNYSDENAIEELCNSCTHLFIDEAHHISAKSWKEIRSKFINKPVIQFTATPFRNDGKALGGKIIYNYKMGDAQREGYFKHINLSSVEEYYDEEHDQSIAERAINILKSDLHSGYDHLIMARVNSKKRANEIIKLYESLCPEYMPVVVHSSNTKKVNEKNLRLLQERKSKVIVCVDMLGEGFDLPNLKIAALHDHHKSLAITLQFIGRFTRSDNTGNIGDASAVVNLADPKVNKELEKLYSQGADWDIVLRRLSQHRIEKEIKLQDVVEDLKKGSGNLKEQISLWNIKPTCSAKIYSTYCKDWEPNNFQDVNLRFEEYWYAIAPENSLLVVLGVDKTAVRWGNFSNLNDINYKILLAKWDSEREALFIYSNDYKSFKVDEIALRICGDQTELVSGKKIFNIFNGIQFPLVRNLGASQIGAISFTQYFGPNVKDGLSLIEESQSKLSNIAGLGYENGDRVIWGCSEKKGKVWSQSSNSSIYEWIEWVKLAWDKIERGGIDEDNITRDFLRPEKIKSNYQKHPLSVQWGEYIQSSFEDQVEVIFDDTPVPFYLVDISIVSNNDDAILLKISSEDKFGIYRFEIYDTPPGYRYELEEGQEVFIRKGRKEKISFSDYMHTDPVFIHYVDGSFSYNCFLVKVNESIGLYSKDDLEIASWTDIDIKKESMGYSKEQDTIQFHEFKKIENDFDLIINDDGSGEAADLIAFKLLDDDIFLSLIHCKYSSKDEPGARLKDLYDVCGQAQRSIKWKHLGMNYLYHRIKHREGLWKKKGYSRFLKGNMKDLVNFRNRARTTKLRLGVTIVQPGISSDKITDDMLKLLGSTALYIKKTTEADLAVQISK